MCSEGMETRCFCLQMGKSPTPTHTLHLAVCISIPLLSFLCNLPHRVYHCPPFQFYAISFVMPSMDLVLTTFLKRVHALTEG